MAKLNRICYVGTIYTLFLYLMHSSLDEIYKTLFLIAPGIPKDVMNRLPYFMDLDEKELRKGFWGNILLSKFYLGWIYHKYIKLKIIIKVGLRPTVYAQDHFDFSATIIGNRPYILIEDSPHIFSTISTAVKLSHNTIFEKTWNYMNLRFYPVYRVLYGKSLYGIMGRNSLCNKVLLSENDDDKSISKYTKIICNLDDEWSNSESSKKEFIKYIFNVTQDDILLISTADVMILTQNLSDMNNISEKELINIYQKIVEQYPGKKILFKLHPRDHIDYDKYIPNISVYNKKIPSQLLYLLGAKLQKVATIYSSAVNGAPQNIEIDWYGVEISEKLKSNLGYCRKPDRAKFCKIS